ncbi:MAG: hypothetical protein WA139_01935 [Candidatus Aenigmatarchaeota archaeon]
MIAAIKIINDLRKDGVDFEVKGIYSLGELKKNVDYLDGKEIMVDGGGKTPKDIFSIRIPVDYVLLTIKMKQLFPELKLDGDLSFEIRKDNSVKIRTESDYTLPIDNKETIGSYFKKFGSNIEFV